MREVTGCELDFFWVAQLPLGRVLLMAEVNQQSEAIGVMDDGKGCAPKFPMFLTACRPSSMYEGNFPEARTSSIWSARSFAFIPA